MAQFDVQFNDNVNVFDASLISNESFLATFDTVVQILPDPYGGDYQVTPRMYEQTLQTENKTMADDVVVYKIPVTYTTNIQGGKTALIG